MTALLLGGSALFATLLFGLFLVGMRNLEREGREGRAALGLELDRRAERREERSERRAIRSEREFRELLARMDAHIAMVRERVDRDRR